MKEKLRLVLIVFTLRCVVPTFAQNDSGNTCWKCPVCGYTVNITPNQLATANPYNLCPLCYSAYAFQFIEVPFQSENTEPGYTKYLPRLVEEWEWTYGLEDRYCDYIIHLVRQTKDGGYIIAGATANSATTYSSFDAVLIKTDSQGREEWNKTFEEADFYSVLEANDGGYVLAGTKKIEFGNDDALLLKVNPRGDVVWGKTYGGLDNDAAMSLQEARDSGFILSGETYSYGAGLWDAWLIKTDSNGNEEWNRTYGGSNVDEARSILAIDDEGYLLTGSTSVGSNYSVLMIKTDPMGVETWKKTYGETEGWAESYAVQHTEDGGYIIAGRQDSDLLLVKTDSYRNKEWKRIFSEQNATTQANTVLQTKDGGYIIAGGKRSGFYNDDWLIKIDSTGREEWNKAFGDQNRNDEFDSIKETNDGGFILAGTKEPYAWLVKLKGAQS
jgi:hypothetical protein